VDYKGNCGRPELLPEIAMVDLFRDFIKYAERTNARRLIECIRYQEFVSKFAICRWRKAFAWKPNGRMYPRHKLGSVQQQCRRWDMLQLASDIGVDTVETAASMP
jgi:hypothetical protein